MRKRWKRGQASRAEPSRTELNREIESSRFDSVRQPAPLAQRNNNLFFLSVSDPVSTFSSFPLSKAMPATFTSHVPQHPLPALYLYPLNDSFIPKHIHLPQGQRIKIGRQTNAKTAPGERNGFFDSKVLSRQHAEVWEESGKVRTCPYSPALSSPSSHPHLTL